MPALARIKRAVRSVIAICGGIDGAAATVLRSRSTVGGWNNLDTRDFPPLDCVLALDEIAVAQGKLPPIICALARELGGVFVPHIDTLADEGTASAKVMELAQRLGVLAGEISAALADDGVIDAAESQRALDAQEALDRVSAQLRQMLQHIAKGGA